MIEIPKPKRWPTIVWARFVVETCGGHRNRNKYPPSVTSFKRGMRQWSGGGRSEGNAPPTRILSKGGSKGVVVGAPSSIL